jgi:SHAQKYF class myb-like DNA-binding protein
MCIHVLYVHEFKVPFHNFVVLSSLVSFFVQLCDWYSTYFCCLYEIMLDLAFVRVFTFCIKQFHFVLLIGEAWSEEEHKKFLLGLSKLGKGDWRGISRNYVGSRTPTQVASHAQKYFIRQTNVHRRKRRSSLFDMVIDDVSISPSTS